VKTEQIMKMPIKLMLDLFERKDDTWFYELVLTVPGCDQSMTIALVQSTEGEQPLVMHVKRNGLDSLDDGARDRLLVRLFQLAHAEMVENDGSAIEWWISDLTRFLRNQFTCTEVAAFSFALLTFVNPAIPVQDMTLVRID
jgi:hypothetical protein